MKIGIIGSSGYIGQNLLKEMSNWKFVSHIVKIGRRKEDDIYLNLEDVREISDERFAKLDMIYFLAAISSPDLCAKEEKKCWNINVSATEIIIKQALENNIKVVFFSSDAVFGAYKTECDEETITKPNTAYGRMKEAIEKRFVGHKNFKVIRLSYVLSKKDKYITYCMNCIKNHKEAEIFHPFYRNVVMLSEVIECVRWLTVHWGEYRMTFLNIAGLELVSRVHIADEIKAIYGEKFQYRIKFPEDEFFINRPKITRMVSKSIWEFNILSYDSIYNRICKEIGE